MQDRTLTCDLSVAEHANLLKVLKSFEKTSTTLGYSGRRIHHMIPEHLTLPTVIANKVRDYLGDFGILDVQCIPNSFPKAQLYHRDHPYGPKMTCTFAIAETPLGTHIFRESLHIDTKTDSLLYLSLHTHLLYLRKHKTAFRFNTSIV